MDEVRLKRILCIGRIKKNPKDEMLYFDGLASNQFRQVISMQLRQTKLMVAQAAELGEIVVRRIGAGKADSIWGWERQIEFRRQFEMNEVPGLKIPQHEVKLTQCRLRVGLKL